MVLAQVKAQGQSDNTVVCIASDHVPLNSCLCPCAPVSLRRHHAACAAWHTNDWGEIVGLTIIRTD
jgi:arylsulfatase A-like enzyme